MLGSLWWYIVSDDICVCLRALHGGEKGTNAWRVMVLWWKCTVWARCILLISVVRILFFYMVIAILSVYLHVLICTYKVVMFGKFRIHTSQGSVDMELSWTCLRRNNVRDMTWLKLCCVCFYCCCYASAHVLVREVSMLWDSRWWKKTHHHRLLSLGFWQWRAWKRHQVNCHCLLRDKHQVVCQVAASTYYRWL